MESASTPAIVYNDALKLILLFNNLSANDDTMSADIETTSDTFYQTITRQGVLCNTTGVKVDVPFNRMSSPDSLMSFKTYDIIEKLTNCLFGPILLLVGVPTNVLCCLVFYKQGLRDRMNLCLFVLAMVDAAFLASSFVVSFYSFLDLVDSFLKHEYSMKISIYFLFFMWAMKSASGCITMVVSVERCVCVVFPLRANSIMRTRTMGALLAAILILNTLGYSIACFRNKLVRVHDEASGRTVYRIEVTDFFIKNHLIYDIIFDIILWFAVPLVTFVVVGVATAITVIQLRTAIAWRASTSSGRGDNHSQQHQAALTKMLVILSCVFMACSVPHTALSIVRLLVPDFSSFGLYAYIFYATHIVAVHFIAAVNSAINFFVYCARSSRFKHELHALCCGGKVKDKLQAEKSEGPLTVVSEY